MQSLSCSWICISPTAAKFWVTLTHSISAHTYWLCSSPADTVQSTLLTVPVRTEPIILKSPTWDSKVHQAAFGGCWDATIHVPKAPVNDLCDNMVLSVQNEIWLNKVRPHPLLPERVLHAAYLIEIYCLWIACIPQQELALALLRRLWGQPQFWQSYSYWDSNFSLSRFWKSLPTKNRP